MKFGLYSLNSSVYSSPKVAAEVAQLAESVGFESLWASEHVVLPDPPVPPSPMVYMLEFHGRLLQILRSIGGSKLSDGTTQQQC